MKKCPQCGREYDVSMMFCLDDGAELLFGPASMDEPATAILHTTDAVGEAPTRAQIHTIEQTAIFPRPEAEPQNSLGDASEKQSFSANRAAKPLGGRIKVIAAIGVAVMLLVAGFFGYRYLGSGANTKQIESIAVMPFVNESGNADVDYLSDGMTETLISSLSQLPKLSVKARSTVFFYKGKETSPKRIGEELGVQAVLFGRVVQRGDDLKLSLELVNTQTGNVLWSEQYNRKQTDLLTLQSDIAHDVSSKLKAKLSGADEAKVTKAYTANPEAYELYLKGRFHFYKGTDAEMKKAVDYYQQATEKDPNYALAYVGLADSYGLASAYVLPPAQAYAKVREAVLKALQIDDGLGEAHATLGTYKLFYERDWQGAENEFTRAITLNPNSPTAAFWYGLYLEASGRFDQAIVQASRSRQLDPLSVLSNSGVQEAYYMSRQYDRAIEAGRKTLELDPENALSHVFLGQSYQQKSMFSEAISEYEKARQIDSSPWVLAPLGNGYAVAGRTADARKVLTELDAAAKQRYVSPYNYALVYTGLGDKDQAFAWLNKADQERNDYLIYLKVEPLFDSLRSDPRFADLLKRIGVPQ